MHYYVKENGRVLGPFLANQVRDLMLQGHFDATMQISANRRDWVPPHEVAEFREWLRHHPLPGTPPPASAPMPGGAKAACQRPAKSLPCLPRKGMAILGAAILCLFFWFLVLNDFFMDTPQTSVSRRKGNDAWQCYDQVKSAIALVAMTLENRETGEVLEIPIGTAFAVSPDTFVTNAHVAFSLTKRSLWARLIENMANQENLSVDEFLQSFNGDEMEDLWEELRRVCRISRVELRINGTGESFPVSQVLAHPNYGMCENEYQNGLYDVAKMKIRGRVKTHFQVAAKRELHALREGQAIASAGFPMEGTMLNLNEHNPVASFADGKIRRLTNAQGTDAGKENNRMIDHSIPAAGGSSGSPIFNQDGKVVAVLWGTAVAAMLDGNGARITSGTLNNFAVRIDQAEDIHENEMLPLEQWTEQ